MREMVIDGFLVPTMMQKAWGSAFRGYRELKRVCDENGLKVFATWGTLLGAVRHHGFIPWDDDIDVCMLRKDYDRLLETVGREGSGYHIEDYVSTGTDNMVRRWVEKSILIYPPEEWEERSGFPFGDVIDIFIMDSLPSDEKKQKKVMEVIADHQRRRNEADSIEKKTEITQELDRYLSTLAESEDNDQVVDLLYYGGNKARILPKEWFDEAVELPFMDGTMSVPAKYREVLERYFGDYRKPVIVFGAHGYPFYEKYLGQLKERFEFEFPRFSCTQAQYDSVMSERTEKVTLSELLLSMAGVLSDAHRDLSASENREFAADLLMQCQQLAIDVGGEVERRAVDSSGIIEVLEAYCDDIYKTHERARSGIGSSFGRILSDAENSTLQGYEDRLRALADRNTAEKKEVLFLSLSAKDMERVSGLREKYCSEPDVHVSVVALPYKDKDAMGLIPDGEWSVDTEGYPDEVELTPFDQYDLEAMHPDVVVYQTPYDEFCDGYTIHPYFYSKNVRKYCDELVFAMSYELMEIVEADFRSRYTLGTFICNPGVIYADRMLVLTEKMKRVCEEILWKWCADGEMKAQSAVKIEVSK
ncbi:MAG: LicD family protein [Eubacterium sp.]|nr:LicD family protein [Eubacterium sp.]